MDDTLRTDPLFLGLTRPTMVWGVPQPVFVINGMVSMIAFLVFRAAFCILICETHTTYGWVYRISASQLGAPEYFFMLPDDRQLRTAPASWSSVLGYWPSV